MGTKIFVVQYPHSQTNTTDKYRVTEVLDLMRYINGTSLDYAFSEFDTYEDACKARTAANEAQRHVRQSDKE